MGRHRWARASGVSRLGAPQPVRPFAALAGHVTFSWQRLEWFEEDERVVVHARDPHTRVDTLRSSREMNRSGVSGGSSP